MIKSMTGYGKGIAELSTGRLTLEIRTLNGKNWTRNYLKQADLQTGARLHFKMASEPNYQRGIADEDKPYSFTNEKD